MISEQREIEAAFVTSVAALRQLPKLLTKAATKVGRAKPVLVRDQYLDTAGLSLFRAGLACRLRIMPKETLIGLKSLTAYRRGLSSRMEVEEKLRSRPPTFPARLPGRMIAARLQHLLGDQEVRVLFELRQKRTVYPVALGGAVLQVSADEVTFVGDRPFPAALHEIEVELLKGSAGALWTLVRQLRTKLKLVPVGQSKFEYGLEWAGISLWRRH